MKRKTRALALALALVLLACGAGALSSGDSLISLSYLTETFFPEAQKKGEEAARNKLQETYDSAKAQLDKVQQEATGHAGLSSQTLEGKDWSDGDAVTLPTGSGFLLLDGSARMTHSGVVVDVMAGTEVLSGSMLAAGHRYLVGEDTTAQVTVLSGAARLGVQGGYSYTKGSGSATPFYDVCQTDWFYTPVGYVYENGLFSGMEEHRFGPGADMTRAMLMTVLYRLAGSPEAELADAQVSFTDVPDSAWYAPFVRWGADREITAGTGEGTFNPEGKITREQLVVLLYSFSTRYLGETEEERTDLSGYQDLEQASAWARDGLSWAVARGIISSTDAGALQLSPGKSATRAEVAAMLRAFAQKALV